MTPLDGAHEAIRDELRRHQTEQPSSFTHDLLGFYHAVTWSDSLLLAIAAHHITVYALLLLTRRVTFFQIALFLYLLLVVYSAETLNHLGREHWRLVATQDYFDPHGLFMAVVFCAPLLAAAFAILINALFTTSSLLIQVKKMQFRSEAAARKKAK